MPRYHFHIREPAERLADDEGIELPDLEAARALAIRSARDVMCGTIIRGVLPLSHVIEIADERGTLLGTVSYAEAVTLA